MMQCNTTRSQFERIWLLAALDIKHTIGIKDTFECFMMVLNYRSATLKPRSPKG